ncbi:hypothetical protein JHK87_033578 [Glycine soja]|nr:hypothetical protein JHK87_033578 [Glycine soja]
MHKRDTSDNQNQEEKTVSTYDRVSLNRLLCRESEKQRVTRKVKWFDDQQGVGRVNDASTGKSFYGPDGPYAMFAGKDTSRALAKMSKNEDDIPPSFDDLSDKAIDVLNDWENKFQAKYLGISYANLAPPVYVVLGSSMDLAVGHVSIASLVLGSMLTEEVSPSEQPHHFLQLGLTSTFFAGIFQAALGILRTELDGSSETEMMVYPPFEFSDVSPPSIITEGTHGGPWRKKMSDLDGTEDEKDFPWWCLDSVLNNRLPSF